MPTRRRVPVGPEQTKRGLGLKDAIAAATPPSPSGPCSCPRLDADDWHEVESDWGDIAFVRTSITAAMGVPIGYTAARESLFNQARRAGIPVPDDPMLLLGEGKFRRPVLLEVEDGGTTAKGLFCPGGVIYSRLVPAPMGQIKRVVSETVEKARVRYGRRPDDVWLWYITCRVCSAERDFETLIVAHYKKA
jgi:hypothetical protein